MTDACHYVFVKTHKTQNTVRVNPTINYELCVIAMCQCKFINGNKHTPCGGC